MMRRSVFALVTLAVLATVLACSPLNFGRRTTGSGQLENRTYDLADFSALDVSHAFEVNVQRGDSYSVVVTADDNLFRYLTVTRRGSTLRLGVDPDAGTVFGTITLRADITMPELTAVSLSGASRCNVSGFASGQDLSAELSGASTLDGDMSVVDARFELSGASRAELAGSAEDLTIDLSGAASLDLSDFRAVNARANLSGGSRASLDVSGRLDYDVSGGSHLDYSGNPSLGATERSGGASVGPR
ncbi:MAG: head GIN domain-containing protein [Anaerolineae bacterium]